MNLISKEIIFSNWHKMRWIALSIGVFLAVMAVWYQEAITGLFSGFFLFQAVTNTGCLVSNSCDVQIQNHNRNLDKETEIQFTEVK